MSLLRRNREVSRLESFSDAMIGFAATLLVVTLEVPRTFSALVASLLGFVPFALSFAVLVTIWAAHNNLFRRYRLDDPTTIVVNSLMLFTVLFYVYPLKFLASGFVYTFFGYGNEVISSSRELQILFIVYAAGWSVVFGCVAFLYHHASASRDRLGLSSLEAFDAVTHGRHYLMFVGAGVLSILLAWGNVGVGIGVPGWAFVLLGPLCWWNGNARAAVRGVLEAGTAPVATGVANG
ncbi:MAG: DUF1211 domain-containing protein [Gemmatimonadaceae bacterium]|nr:DUF1211 domain-containing protein [Gemmatimonadaceae bacterium]